MEKKPTQDKICNWVRFLDSLSLPRNDMSGGGAPFCPHGLYSLRSMVVLRAANQNLLIAGGNHTLIPSMNHRRYIGYTVYGAIPSTRTGYKCHVAGGRPYMRNTIQPHVIYSQRPRNGIQAVPYGFAGRWILSTTRVVFATICGDGSSPLHCVVPFIRTGSIRNGPLSCCPFRRLTRGWRCAITGIT